MPRLNSSARSSSVAVGLVVLAAFLPARDAVATSEVSYNFQVRPILAEHCFKCHGSDVKQRKGKLRLDTREGALEKKAIVPGKPDESEAIKRILTTDEEDIMPPLKEHRPMSAEKTALLRRWIEQGAAYQQHWSFILPVKAPLPTVAAPGGTALHPIDLLVRGKLQQQGIKPAEPAKREAWLRRVSLDLTGLPPTLEDVDDFVRDGSDGAFEKVVDRLLGSTAYGERMAVDWLDVARFADTFGRHEDADSDVSAYRDWVIKAFNSNLPYDKFVLHQTAGDMVPGATQDMYVATAFNRLVQQSNEAGSNEEEFRIEHVADRMRTNGSAFLGLSLECCRCHDHKYDPLTMKDYYSMASFLSNVDELGLYSRYTDAVPAPSLMVYQGDEERQHAELKLRISAIEREREAMRSQAQTRFASWLSAGGRPKEAKPIVHLPLESFEAKFAENVADSGHPGQVRRKPSDKPAQGRVGKALHLEGDNWVSVKDAGDFNRTHPFSLSIWLKISAIQPRAVVVHHSRAGLDAASRGYEILLEDGKPSFALSHFYPGNALRIKTKQPLPLHAWTQIVATYDGSSRAAGARIYINGFAVETEVVRDHLYKDIVYEKTAKDLTDVEDVALAAGGRYNDQALKDAFIDELKCFDRELTPVEVRLLSGGTSQTKPEEWFDWYLREVDAPSRALAVKLMEARKQENDLAMKVREIMVMREMPFDPRPAFVLERGRFDSRREQVQPGTPASVLPFPEDLPKNRLGYAKWLTDRRNPLTARVFVNRVWQIFFGRGIVGTSEEFGMQGELPTNPELLDWLAVDFMESGWDIKGLCRQIALSATYKQSVVPADLALLKDDPDNRLLARGPRQRLTAEQLRDSALAVSGLLSPEIGGRSVKPYQPEGLYDDAGVQAAYIQDHGDKLHRRSLYTYWKRTLPPPAMTVFDAPTREFCKVRRDRSSTPLQALVLFNDPQFIEAARVLAAKLVEQHPKDDVARMSTAYRILTSQSPDEWQQQVMVKSLQAEREALAKEPALVEKLLKVGEFPTPGSLPAAEVAATASVVRALMAYDEVVMKP